MNDCICFLYNIISSETKRDDSNVCATRNFEPAAHWSFGVSKLDQQFSVSCICYPILRLNGNKKHKITYNYVKIYCRHTRMPNLVKKFTPTIMTIRTTADNGQFLIKMVYKKKTTDVSNYRIRPKTKNLLYI